MIKFFEFLQNKGFFVFQKDLETKKALERNIEIIGEAINRILKNKNSEAVIKNARKKIGTRNRIAHEYDTISDEVIWTIIIKEQPKLKKKST